MLWTTSTVMSLWIASSVLRSLARVDHVVAAVEVECAEVALVEDTEEVAVDTEIVEAVAAMEVVVEATEVVTAVLVDTEEVEDAAVAADTEMEVEAVVTEVGVATAHAVRMTRMKVDGTRAFQYLLSV